MPDVVNHAAAMAHPGDIVILSPASASFDQYKSYVDRGEQFAAAVEKL
jgi:UDP-N-acetylmuramoylalanine--D-glutamate ligase